MSDYTDSVISCIACNRASVHPFRWEPRLCPLCGVGLSKTSQSRGKVKTKHTPGYNSRLQVSGKGTHKRR